jgi:ABC-type Zn2+ transport system substrate-binding protein/surface adhesin
MVWVVANNLKGKVAELEHQLRVQGPEAVNKMKEKLQTVEEELARLEQEVLETVRP